MGLFDIFKKQADNEDKSLANTAPQSNNLIENAEYMLAEVNVDLSKADKVEIPINGLVALGSGVASMLPQLRTITRTITQSDDSLYRCVIPKGVNGWLAKDKLGNNLGTVMNENGIVAQARWVKADPVVTKITEKLPVDPTKLMMAAALAEIEKKLDNIIEMEKLILSFLEEDKEAKIEGDLKTLTTIVKEYKFNWDNATYTATHHQVAADIKRDAEANMIFYQKQVANTLKENRVLVLQQDVDSTRDNLIKKFRYYRLSLYLYAFSSFVEVMLQGKYEQGYIDQVRQDIIDRSDKYQETYDACYKQLANLTGSSVEHFLLKGLGTAGKALGNLIGSIPVIKDGQVDEWLVENGSYLEKNGDNYGVEALKRFETIRDSGSGLFVENLAHMNRVFNQTGEIYIGKDTVYLVNSTVV